MAADRGFMHLAVLTQYQNCGHPCVTMFVFKLRKANLTTNVVVLKSVNLEVVRECNGDPCAGHILLPF